MSEVLDAVKRLEETSGAALDSHKTAIEDLSDRVGNLEAIADRPTRDTTKYSRDEIEHKDVFTAWMRSPNDGRAKRNLEEAEHEMSKKAITIGTDSAGGYALPAIIANQVEARVTALNPFRRICRVQRVGSSDYAHLVSRNEQGSGWVGEGGTRSETTTSTLIQRKPTFGTLYARPKCSEEALDDIFFDVESWLVNEVSDAFAAAEATAFVSGNGTNQPTGFLNATPVTTADRASPERAEGTLQYIPMDSASPQALGADDLYDLVGGFQDGYLQGPGCAWVMRNATYTVIRKLKDSYGAYLLEPSLQEGVPGRLLGYPVYVTSAMQAYVTDAHPVAFGNWQRGYLIADRSDIRITIDANITTPGQVLWYLRKRVGGITLNDECIKVLKYTDA